MLVRSVTVQYVPFDVVNEGVTKRSLALTIEEFTDHWEGALNDNSGLTVGQDTRPMDVVVS